MKQLLGAITLFLIATLMAFLYRNVLERDSVRAELPGMACTQEAKLCPDGSAVGRTGPACAFAMCPLPNREIDAAAISFVLPAVYEENPKAVQMGDSLLAAYEKKDGALPHNAIVVRRFPIPEGKTAESVLLANTMYETSGQAAKSMKEFKSVTVGDKVFQSITVERFEAQVHTLYYLTRTNDVLRFEALDHDVTNWMEPSLVVGSLETHKALLEMLATLKTD